MRRRTFQSFLAVGALVAGFVGMGSSAQAALTIAPLIGGGPGVNSGTKYENFDSVQLGWNGGSQISLQGGLLAVSFTDGFGDTAQAVKNSLGGQYAAPYVNGTSNTLPFGNAANATDSTVYLTTGKTADVGPPATGGGIVTLSFTGDQKYFGLLWGSVDDYNSLYFYDATDTLIGTVTGSDVISSPNGNQGPQGSTYVNITSNIAFRKVVAASKSFAFEFDNVAFNNSTVLTPEPATAVMGLIAVGFVGMRRRMKKTADAA